MCSLGKDQRAVTEGTFDTSPLAPSQCDSSIHPVMLPAKVYLEELGLTVSTYMEWLASLTIFLSVWPL